MYTYIQFVLVHTKRPHRLSDGPSKRVSLTRSRSLVVHTRYRHDRSCNMPRLLHRVVTARSSREVVWWAGLECVCLFAVCLSVGMHAWVTIYYSEGCTRVSHKCAFVLDACVCLYLSVRLWTVRTGFTVYATVRLWMVGMCTVALYSYEWCLHVLLCTVRSVLVVYACVILHYMFVIGACVCYIAMCVCVGCVLLIAL